MFAFPHSDLAEARESCERLRRAVETHDWRTLHPALQVTLSMGVTDELALGSVEAMLARADDRLYEAKRAGRNRVCAGRLAQPAAALA